MGWSALFLDALAAPLARPVWTLRRVIVASEPGQPWEASSHPNAGADYRLGRVDVEGSAVQARSWTSRIGGFSVELVGDPTTALASLPRGTIVELVLSLGDGLTERFLVGQVRSIRGWGASVTIECLDLLSALRSPLSADTTAYWFASVTGTTTTTALALPGAASYLVADTTGFQRETGGNGAIKVTPSGGDAYYRLWSASTATTFTISGPGDATVGNTDDVGCLNGDAVAEAAYISGHPVDLVGKVLTSTGNGTNGTDDVLPDTWGLRLTQDLYDRDDAQAVKEWVAVLSGSYLWQWFVDAPVDDLLGTLEGLLSPAGIWVTQRQGALTVRAIADSHGNWGTTPPVVLTIDGREVVAIEEYDAWDVGHDLEYVEVKATDGNGVTSAGSSDGTSLKSLPARRTLYQVLPAAFENEGELRAEVTRRLAESTTRVPERLVLRCATLRLAQLCAGDQVLLSLVDARFASRKEGRGRNEAGALGGFNQRVAVVYAVSPDPATWTTRVGLWIYPDV